MKQLGRCKSFGLILGLAISAGAVIALVLLLWLEASKAMRELEKGRACLDAGDHEHALESFQKVLATFNKFPRLQLEKAACYKSIGVALDGMGRFEEAIAAHRNALLFFAQQVASEKDQADCHVNIGVALSGLGRYEEAIAEQQNALQLYAELAGGEIFQAHCHVNIGVALSRLERSEEAIAAQKCALQLYGGVAGSERYQAHCQVNIGVALGNSGRYEEAIAAQENARRQYSAMKGTEQDQAKCDTNIGYHLLSLGRPDEALEQFNAVLNDLHELAGMERFQAELGLAIGTVLINLGCYDDGIGKTREALASLTELAGSERWRAECHLRIGIGLSRLGRYEEAIQEMKTALEAFEGLSGEQVNQARCRYFIGETLLEQRQYSAAVELLVGAINVAPTWASYDALSRALQHWTKDPNFGLALDAQLKAINWAERSRSVIRNPEWQISWFEDVTVIYENLVSRLVFMKEREFPLPEYVANWGTLEDIALYYAERGKGRTLMELLQGRTLPRTGDGASSLLVRKVGPDDKLAKLLSRLVQDVRQGDQGGVGRSADETPQRTSDSMALGTGPASSSEPEPFEPVEFARTLRPDEACLEYVVCEQELIVLLVTARGVQVFRREIARDAPRELRDHGRPNMTKLVEAYRRMPETADAVGLEGLVWLQREWMDRWRNRTLSEVEHVAISNTLAQVVLPPELRQALAAEGAQHLVIVPSRALVLTSFATLVAGFRDEASRPKSLATCRFLVEDYSLSYIQSLSLLKPLRQRSEEKRRQVLAAREFLAFADPVHDESDPRTREGPPGLDVAQREYDRAGTDTVVRGLVRGVKIAEDSSLGGGWDRLPETRGEAEAAARLFGGFRTHETAVLNIPDDDVASAVCVGFAANRVMAKSHHLPQYRHVYFGVHGHSDMANPWLSSLMLTDLAAQSGRRQPVPLTMADVFGMELRAETVMLAACKTAMGRMRAGEGVVGFQLAFLFAGADTLVLTQWEVPSTVDVGNGGGKAYPTSDIVVGFYRGMQEEKLSRAEALRQSQLQVRRQGGQLADPFYWGAWQLSGEWRSNDRVESAR